MSKHLIIAFFLFLVATAGAMAQKKEKPIAFVYGSIQGVAGLRHVYIQKLGKVYVGNFNRPKTEALNNGTFFFEKVEPGDYYLAGFSIRGGDLYWIPYTKETVYDALIEIKDGELVNIGAYNITDVKGNIWKSGSFKMDVASSPSWQEMISQILEHVKSDDWRQALQKQLN